MKTAGQNTHQNLSGLTSVENTGRAEMIGRDCVANVTAGLISELQTKLNYEYFIPWKL